MTRREVAERLGKSVAAVRRIEGILLHPTRDARGVHHFDDHEVEALAERIRLGDVSSWQELQAEIGASTPAPLAGNARTWKLSSSSFAARWNASNPHPKPEQRAELVRWFWRTGLAGRYQGANTGRMAEDLSRMQRFARGESHSIASDVAFAIAGDHFIGDGFRLNTASGKTFALLLGSGGPRSLFDGAAIDIQVALAKPNRVEFHHLFPKAFLARKQVPPVDQNRLANICMLNLRGNRRFADARPSEYLQRAAESWGDQKEKILATNFLSGAPWRYACEDDYDSFCLARAELLADRAKELGTL